MRTTDAKANQSSHQYRKVLDVALDQNLKVIEIRESRRKATDAAITSPRLSSLAIERKEAQTDSSERGMREMI